MTGDEVFEHGAYKWLTRATPVVTLVDVSAEGALAPRGHARTSAGAASMVAFSDARSLGSGRNQTSPSLATARVWSRVPQDHPTLGIWGLDPELSSFDKRASSSMTTRTRGRAPALSLFRRAFSPGRSLV